MTFRPRLAALFMLAATSAPFLITPLASSGAVLPKLEADALDGTHVSLPSVQGDKPFVLVVAYDRSAKDATQKWAHELFKALGSKAAVYAVIDAAGAPGLVHGFVTKDAVKSAPQTQPQHRSNILITFSRDGWTGLAPTGDKSDPAIVIVDAAHRIVFSKREAFRADALSEAVSSVP